MRIHLLCDHKWRDLPNLAALKLRLEFLGHRVLLSTTKDARAMIAAFRPDCVVFNHLFSAANRELARTLQQGGVGVVVLPTEGAVRPELLTLSAGEFSDYRVADLILAWSETSAKDIRDRWGFDHDRVPAAGCTRFDFYHPAFASVIVPRERFCATYDLDPTRPIVTWATQYGYAHLNGDAGSPQMAQWLRELDEIGVTTCYGRIGMDPLRIPGIHANGRAAAAQAFFALAKAMPDVQFLIKPHPIEELEFYRGRIVEAGCENIRFCPSTYIWDVLNATDVQLHRHCTTAVETWLWRKPTIELGMDPSPGLNWFDREEGSDMARDTDELIALVAAYLDGAEVDAERQAYRDAYVEKWFGTMDGRRCKTAGDLIDDFLRKRGKRRGLFHPMPGLRVSMKGALTAAARYRLGVLPDVSLVRRHRKSTVVAHDKLILRGDVAAYESRLRGVANLHDTKGTSRDD